MSKTQTTNAPPPVVLTRPDLCKMLRMSRSTVYRLAARCDDSLPRPAFYVGDHARWRRDDVLRWLASRSGQRLTVTDANPAPRRPRKTRRANRAANG